MYDTDKESFQEFLKFIYTGHLETESKSLENLVELMALSDQYEVIFQMCYWEILYTEQGEQLLDRGTKLT